MSENLMEEIVRLKAVVDGLQQAAQAKSMDQDEENDEEAEEDPWAQVLQGEKTVPGSPNGLALVNLLGSPPPLNTLRNQAKTQPKFAGVPETPPARKNRIDNNLHVIQGKLEMAMHALVKSQETNNMQQVGQVAAWFRSAWQDAH
jgi:hypothetical protein